MVEGEEMIIILKRGDLLERSKDKEIKEINALDFYVEHYLMASANKIVFVEFADDNGLESEFTYKELKDINGIKKRRFDSVTSTELGEYLAEIVEEEIR
jgi:hypothetical protein